MPYTYHTDEDRKAMLAVIGVKSEDELIDVIPEKFHLRTLLPIEKGRPSRRRCAPWESSRGRTALRRTW
jgi:glycine cleavage system pyridoxal-binding protein P